MRDYCAMSDLEINAQVSKELYGSISRGHQLDLANGTVDYCNNITDAWPIILEQHIAVVPYRHTSPKAWPTAFGVISKLATEDKNALRAAMIVFF